MVGVGMNRAYQKNIFRTITKSLGRYMAIFAIIALGVGFLVGLKASKPSMMETGQQYVADTKLYDYRLLSTWGFTEEEIGELRELPGVEAVEGALWEDFLYTDENGEDSCLKALSITTQTNLPTLTAGRMPESPQECLLDAVKFPESVIGSEVHVSDNNGQETLDGLAYDTYTVTGLARTPLYMSTERGTTTVGNGQVDALMFLLPEGFSYEYLEEAYVRCAGGERAFSEEYDDRIEADADALEAGAEEVVFARYEQELSDAKQEIADGEQELSDGEQELEDAKRELEEQTAKGEQELADAKRELEDGAAELEDAKRELAANEALLAEKRQELLDGEAALSEGEAQYQQGLSEFRAQLEEGWRQLAEGEAALEAGRAEIQENEQKIEDGWKDYEDGQRALEEETAKAEKEIADAEADLSEGRQELSDAKEELQDVEEPEVHLLDRSMNVGYASYESDVSIVEGVAVVFPLFFFLIAALVCSTTMTRMVDDERTQIGTLRAIGYSEGAILAKYLIYSGSAATLGAIFGYSVGSRLFPTVIWVAYSMIYGFTDIILVDDLWLFLVSLLVSLLCSAGTTYAACRIELRNAPAELIRPKAPSAGKRIWLERIPAIWNRLKFLHKVSLRNIFRFKKRMIMMILGIAGCTALVMAGFGVRDSVSNIVNNQYDQILKYDINALYSKEVTEQMIEQVRGEFGDEIQEQVVLQETSAECPYDGGSKGVTLMVAEDEGIRDCVDFHWKGKTSVFPGYGEILLDNRLSDVLSVGVGDEVSLRIGEKDIGPLKVCGIFENYTFYYACVTAETYEAYVGEPYEPKSVYLALSEDADAYEIASYLSDMPNSVNMSVVADMRARVENTMQSMNYIVALVIGCAAALAFIVLFNLGNINISERVREIATLKVLGFYPRETGAYVFRENVVLSIMGILCGLPLGVLLHRFVMLQIKIDMVSFDIRILPLSYLYSVLAVLGFTVCVDLIMRRKIERIQMAESLKSIE